MSKTVSCMFAKEQKVELGDAGRALISTLTRPDHISDPTQRKAPIFSSTYLMWVTPRDERTSKNLTS